MPKTYTVTLTPATVAPNGTLTVRWTAPSGTSTSDWLGLARVGDPATSSDAWWWTYTNGTASGSLSLTAPSTPGSYELRYLLDDDYVVAARSSPVTVGSAPLSDTIPPLRTNGAPTGTLPASTTSTTLRLTTNEAATCKAGSVANTPYAGLPLLFTTTGGTSHATTLSGLTNGQTYTRYIRCQDGAGNVNSTDYPISFAVAASTPPPPPPPSPPPPLGDSIPPTVSITTPASGATVSGTVAISATAADNVGVLGVQFQVDGLLTGTEDPTAPYTYPWVTTGVSPGAHSLTAVARDAAGHTTTSAAVPVTVTAAAPTTYTVTVIPTTVAPGGSLTVHWTAPTPSSTFDWLGLYPVGGNPMSGYTWWTYTGGVAGGSRTLTVPQTPGSYELRYLLNNGYIEAAKSGTVTVQ